jgi:uridine phosphorylase
MESATLFIVASALRARCATVLLLCRNREREALQKTEEISTWETAPAIETAVEALRSLIKKEKPQA